MSHFSTVKTQLRKKAPLLKALQTLGYVPLNQTMVRGYRGQTIEADLAVKTPNGGNIGFRFNPSNKTYELVTDLDLWKEAVPLERFVSQLTQNYALNTVLSTAAEEGFEVTQQKNNQDGSIELVVTRWDS